MPEHLRALIVILLLAATVFAFARRSATTLMAAPDFNRRWGLWFALTLVAFLARDPWVFFLVAGMIVLAAGLREPNRPALFFFLLFLFPPVAAQIPGFGLVNYLFSISYPRLLALVLLLPAAVALARAQTATSGFKWPDRLLLAYLVLTVVMQLRETTVTDTLRQAFYALVDVWLPYHVASRGLRNRAELGEALACFVSAALVLSLVGVFEFLKHWLLYSSVVDALGLKYDLSAYLGRGDLLRAMASTGHSIALGFVVAVAIGFQFVVAPSLRGALQRRLAGLLLAAGVVAPLSRGPWVGVAALVTVFILSGHAAMRRLILLGLAGLLALPLLAVLPGGGKVLDLLPFVGNVERENIDYRERLLDNAIVVIGRNPWFGSVNYLDAPEMQAMIQGQGIIDVVNTYVGIALEYGLVGLALFAGCFVAVLRAIRSALRSLPDQDDDAYRLGRALFATLLGILVVIFTVSSISIIPMVYWSVAGLGVAYARMVKGGNA